MENKQIRISTNKQWIPVNIGNLTVDFHVKKPTKADILRINKKYAKIEGGAADTAMLKECIFDWRPDNVFIDDDGKSIPKDKLDLILQDVGMFSLLVQAVLNPNIIEAEAQEIEDELKNS
jgi:hypothetical protein